MLQKKSNLFQYKLEVGLYPGALLIGCIFCLQIDRPITGGGSYKRKFMIFTVLH